jgi:spore maturation protein CgeB
VHDVSFVGQPHGNRRAVIEALRSAGVDVYTRGYGWEEGRVSQDEMIRIFNQSRINLNLPNAATPSPQTSTKATLRSHARSAASLVQRVPFGDRLVGAASSTLRASRSAIGGSPVTSALGEDAYPEQIKGRNFEIPGCGGFLLTGPAEELDRYYEPGREIAVFSSLRELVDGVRHYLAHDDERRAIADAGYARTLAEHTYAHRFEAIFERIGLGVSTRKTT